MKKLLHVMSEKDNVAVVLADLTQGTRVPLENVTGSLEIELRNDIPFGHKVAIAPIKAGELVIKYGEPIGVATQDIMIGEHVHTHNLESQRARGDLHTTNAKRG